MAVFKNIPQPSDQRSQSQGDILGNMNYLLTNPPLIDNLGILPVDHLATGDNDASPSDGFHLQSSYLTQSTPSTLVNPVNGQSSNGIAYVSPDNNNLKQFNYYNADGIANNYQITPCLPLRASANFGWDGSAVITRSSFNCVITRISTGKYTLTFTPTSKPPTNNYLVVFGAMRGDTSSNGDAFAFVQGQTFANYATSCTTSFINFGIETGNANLNDPSMCSIMVFGG